MTSRARKFFFSRHSKENRQDDPEEMRFQLTEDSRGRRKVFVASSRRKGRKGFGKRGGRRRERRGVGQEDLGVGDGLLMSFL